jgi:cobyrinic acid a,c-diamide synthase
VAGTRVTGHEFHRTKLVDAVEPSTAAWLLDGEGHGIGSATLHASYLHTHWAGHPQMAQRFADAVHAYSPEPTTPRTSPSEAEAEGRAELGNTPARSAAATESRSWPEASAWHGDAELAEGLVDFAVNVHDGARPGWLDDALRASLGDIGAYPDAAGAELAIARRHGRPAGEVLATAGAAEAFSLIARARPWKHPVVVHPQFTEPDAALLAAGHTPGHVLCDPGAGFVLDPDRVPADADLVIVGNPTNPTSVLHTARTLRALLVPGRVVVVDEAFMDSVPGEQHSLVGAPLPGLLVVRSLTKLWSIPGVRAGYVVGDRQLIAELRAHQSPWSVSSQAVAAMIATASEQARAEAAQRATRIGQHRAVLIDGLVELGIDVVAPAAPFVLAKVGRGVHERLRSAGYAVRRADTFPGLDDSWVRIAVRRPDTTRKLLAALRIEGLATS